MVERPQGFNLNIGREALEMTSNNDAPEMPEEIWVGHIYEAIEGEYWLRCDPVRFGVDDIKYIRTDRYEALQKLAQDMAGALELMQFIADRELQEYIQYDFNDKGELFFFAWLNDWFFYASSYEVEVTPQDLPLLKQCVDKCEAANECFGSYGVNLFGCIKEGLPPLREYIKKGKYQLPKELIPLFKDKALQAYEQFMAAQRLKGEG